MNFTANDVEPMIEEQRDYYYTGATKSTDFRIEQLHRLKSVIQSHETDVIEALKKDLGKSEFEAYATEVGFVLDSIGSMAKNLED